MTTSPTQRLMGRRTRSLLPAAGGKLEHGLIHSRAEAQSKEDRRVRESTSNGRSLKELVPGDNVRVQPYSKDTREWKEGKVERQITSRSYEVTTPEGRTLRRNRQQLRKKPESTHSRPPRIHPKRTVPEKPPATVEPRVRPPATSNEETNDIAGKDVSSKDDDIQTSSNPSPVTTTRSGRVVKKPMKYEG